MLPSHTVEATHSEATLDKLSQLLRNEKHTDVTFTLTDEDGTCHKIPAHRLVLASQSEYFDRMLFGEMREAQPGVEIPLPDTPLEAFQLLLKYAYTGQIKISNANFPVSVVVQSTNEACSIIIFNFAAHI